MPLLKQGTALDLGIGPFVDATDGVTAETGLTISQADVRLKKNGGNWAQKNDANAATHEENGWYEVPLNATDTNTLGILTLSIRESGALPVWREYMVVPPNVYDALVAGSDNLQVHAVEIANSLITASAIASGALTQSKFGSSFITSSSFALGAITAAAIAADAIGASELAADAAAEIRDAILDRLLSAHTGAGTVGERLGRIPNAAPGAAGGLPVLDGQARVAADALAINGDSEAPEKLAAGLAGVTPGEAVGGTLSTTQVSTDLTETTNNHYVGRIVAWRTGALRGQVAEITAYDGATKVLTVSAMTEAPTAGDSFAIL